MRGLFATNLIRGKFRQKLKRVYYRSKSFISRNILAYDRKDLERALLELGLCEGDTVMVHASFDAFNGFNGNAQDVVSCFLELIGEEGNLLMVSMPYTSSSLEYFRTKPVFDLRRTMSKMGLISEIFRRRKDVLRSLNPSHPVLAWGKDREWIVEDHQKCPYPCGTGSPFHKFHRLKGKILFFDVPFRTFTFIHYIEDLMKDRLPFPLYHENTFSAQVKDLGGKEIMVPTHVFSEQAFTTRNPVILEKELIKRKALKRKRVGNTNLMLLNAADAVQCSYQMLDSGRTFYN